MATARQAITDHAADTPARVSRLEAAGPTDRLTLARVFVLIAGAAIGIRYFFPDSFQLDETDSWREAASGILIGLSLPGPLLVMRLRRPRRRVGIGGLLWSTLGLGAIVLLPPSIADPGADARGCLYYVLPLMALWFLIAAAVGGRLRARHVRQARWSEKFGLYLGVLWSPLALWIIYDFYVEAFF